MTFSWWTTKNSCSPPNLHGQSFLVTRQKCLGNSRRSFFYLEVSSSQCWFWQNSSQCWKKDKFLTMLDFRVLKSCIVRNLLEVLEQFLTMLEKIKFLTMLEQSKFLTMLEKNQVPHNVGFSSLKILHCEELARVTRVVPHNAGKHQVPHNVRIK